MKRYLEHFWERSDFKRKLLQGSDCITSRGQAGDEGRTNLEPYLNPGLGKGEDNWGGVRDEIGGLLGAKLVYEDRTLGAVLESGHCRRREPGPSLEPCFKLSL